MSSADKEIQAIQQVAGALDGLDEETIGRILDWAIKRFKVTALEKQEQDPGIGTDTAPSIGQFTEFVDLYDAASPDGEAARSLVAAYWVQEVEGQGTFTADRVNALLTDMGRKIANITKTMTRLQNKKPALVRQVSKSGRAQQSRKTYKMTLAGIKEVQQMLATESSS